MDSRELLGIFRETARRLLAKEGYGQLLFVHQDKERRVVVEAEVRCVLTQLLSENGCKFGVEVPTKEQYVFKGKGKRPTRGRTDVVIDPEGHPINIELKAAAQANEGEFRGLRNDLSKLLCEQADAVASFHVIERNTMTRLMKGYRKAYSEAIAEPRCTSGKPKSKPYLLFVLDRRNPPPISQTWDDMTRIDSQDFAESKFNPEHLAGD